MVMYMGTIDFSRFFHLGAGITSFMAGLMAKRLNRVTLVGTTEVKKVSDNSGK